MDGILEAKDQEPFATAPDRVLHVAVFCTSSKHANRLMHACQAKAGRRREHVVTVQEPLKEIRRDKTEEKHQLLQRRTRTLVGSSSSENCLNRICQYAWKAISTGRDGLVMLVNYAGLRPKESLSSFVNQISQIENLVERFLPEWSFGFPLTRYCFYILPDYGPLDLKELISAHRHIIFPEKSNNWEHSFAEDLLGRPERSIGVETHASVPKNLQAHVAMAALGAPGSRFTFKLPTGEVQTIARNLREFVEILPALSQETFNFHLLRWATNALDGEPLRKPVLRSDFALWIAYGLHDCPLGMEIFELAYSRTRGQDLSELSDFGQQMLHQAVSKTCANRLTFLESYLTKILGVRPKREMPSPIRAFLLVNTREVNITKLSAEISSMPGVERIFNVDGPYEFLIKLSETTVETLRAAIGAIRGLPNVASTLTLPEDEKVFQA